MHVPMPNSLIPRHSERNKAIMEVGSQEDYNHNFNPVSYLDQGRRNRGGYGGYSPPRNCTVGLSSAHYVLPSAVCKSFSPPNLILLPLPLISTLICFTPARRTSQIYSSGTSAGKSKLKILEIGCGPVIACQISAAPHTSEITVAELAEFNHNVLHL